MFSWLVSGICCLLYFAWYITSFREAYYLGECIRSNCTEVEISFHRGEKCLVLLFDSVSIAYSILFFFSSVSLTGRGQFPNIKCKNLGLNKPLFIFISQSRTQRKITKLAKTEKDSLLYAADGTGCIYIYNINKLIRSPEQKNPKGYIIYFPQLYLW